MDNAKLAANEDTVRRMTNHMIAAFEAFIGQELDVGQRVGYLDSFMAAHNLHVSIVLHLEREAEFDGAAARMFRRMAIDTFAQRMRDEPTAGKL